MQLGGISKSFDSFVKSICNVNPLKTDLLFQNILFYFQSLVICHLYEQIFHNPKKISKKGEVGRYEIWPVECRPLVIKPRNAQVLSQDLKLYFI